MKKNTFLSIFIILSAILFCTPNQGDTGPDNNDSASIRNPILAGTWYPRDKKTLQKSIRDYLGSVSPPRPEGNIKAIIVPHAGHHYSGRVAAHAYKLIKNENVDRVIMIGPSHRFGFRGVSVNLQSGYRTPLGTVSVDKVWGEKIIDTSPNIKWVPQAHAYEHSLEIQIPFLQTVLKDFKIIPIVMGQQDLQTCTELSASLIKAIGRSDRTLLLASTDLSHFHDYNKALKLDSTFTGYVKSNDSTGLAKAITAGKCEACGVGPVITIMMTAYNLKADRTVILNYANSGDVTGDHSRVVGYLSAVLIRTK